MYFTFAFAFARQTNVAKAKNLASCAAEDGNGEGGEDEGGNISSTLSPSANVFSTFIYLEYKI